MLLSSLDRGLSVMEYLVQNRCASVSEVARVFSIDKSTASRILSVLAAHDLVYKDEQSMIYYPSPGTLLYSCRTMMDYQILDVVHPQLTMLSERYGVNAHICTLRNHHVLILDQVRSPRNRFLQEPALPGMVEPLHCSAIGKCVLAWMPEEMRQEVLKTCDFKTYTAHTLTTPEALEEEIKQVRKNGYAKDQEEIAEGLCCLAVPIFDEKNRVSFSIGISGDWSILEDAGLRSRALEDMRHAARRIGLAYSAFGSTNKKETDV